MIFIKLDFASSFFYDCSMTYEELLSHLSKPAQRALNNANIKSIDDLMKYTDKDLLKLHGLGPASLPWIHQAIK